MSYFEDFLVPYKLSKIQELPGALSPEPYEAISWIHHRPLSAPLLSPVLNLSPSNIT